jgi:hypothetical protein
VSADEGRGLCGKIVGNCRRQGYILNVTIIAYYNSERD